MSEHTETSGRPLASAIKKEDPLPGNLISISSPLASTKQLKAAEELSSSSSVSSSTTQRREATSTASSGPHAGSSRPEQKPAARTKKMSSLISPVHYTRTGRVSKAKKGLKVHNCECGRSYTRAEHLRRHQKNHTDALICEHPDCGRKFYRLDLLLRHKERHNDIGKQSRGSSVLSSARSSTPPPRTMPELPRDNAPILSPPSTGPIGSYPQLQIQRSSAAGSPTPTRYNYTVFRTPKIPQFPRTPHQSFSGLSAMSLSSPTSIPNQKILRSMSIGYQPIPLSIDSSSMPWTEPLYSQSPPYSSSSSPVLQDSQIVPGLAYDHQAFRTRASSIASYVEQPLCTPHSPMSTNLTIPNTWPQDDKTTGLAYIYPSYSITNSGYTTSIHAMAGYGHYSAKSMMQRDEEEGVILFPEQPYGMGQTEHVYPSEQFLNNYWRLFHPTFPVVHRPTFQSMSKTPMLYAAMIAIGGQYSNNVAVKQKSRVLHDRCIKLLEKRTHEAMAEGDRTVDFQAIFLVEVLSQYRARRAAKILSPRFGTVYHQATLNFQQRGSQLSDIILSLNQAEESTFARWIHWVELTTWQHLLVSCYILESQQAMLLARESHASMLPVSGLDLPYPTTSQLWDAQNVSAWSSIGRQYCSAPNYVFEALQSDRLSPGTHCQSALLIATNYNRFGASASYDNMPIHENIHALLDSSVATRSLFMTAKLTQVTPLRALLAVSGESWILSEKVSSPQNFVDFKNILRTWVYQLWLGPPSDTESTPVKKALDLSVQMIQSVMDEHIDMCTLEMGSDMGLYFAALIFWTITVAITTSSRLATQPTQQAAFSRRHSEAPGTASLLNAASQSAMTTPFTVQAQETERIASVHNKPHGFDISHSQPASSIRRESLSATASLSHDQIAADTRTFLAVASQSFVLDPLSQSHLSLNVLQKGCTSLLFWTKLRLRGVSIHDERSHTSWLGPPGNSLGELLDSMIGSLERVLSRGWRGWGF